MMLMMLMLLMMLVVGIVADAVFFDSPADPKCLNGTLEESTLVCCPKECTVCGGEGCGAGGLGDECCTGSIKKDGRDCDKVGAPCNIAPAPPCPTECGCYPQPLSTTQPNVLLIGDSISMPVPFTPGGYGNNTRWMLEAKNISVQHNGGWGKGGQASNTPKGLSCTNTSTSGNWFNFTGTFDIIHFNFGLHDLVASGPGEGAEHVDIPQYMLNIKEIFTRLSTRAKHVIWTTTTPCPNVTTSMGRSDAKVIAYNKAAMTALSSASNVLVDDLYAAVDGYCGKNYKTCDLQLPANVHFTSKGCEFMAEHVVAKIMQVLSADAKL